MNPYKSLDDRAFWSLSVGQRNMFDIADLWRPKFEISPELPTATFGSCFAQHFAGALRDRGFAWLDAEKAPTWTPVDIEKRFNYGIFSARTGNIYTTSLLLQWTRWALELQDPPQEVWEKDGRFFDPFRPAIELDGFASAQEVHDSRALTLRAFRRAIKQSRLFVFTMGLTESWWNANEEYEYPMCPGTVAGTFDATAHKFINQDYATVHDNLQTVLDLMQRENPELRVLLTVSPVPLTATNSDNHVLVATMESKSVLRAVAGATARANADVDYFPSYEIINAAPFRGTFFESNQRSVNRAGVDHVMRNFFAGLSAAGMATTAVRDDADQDGDKADDLVCEEVLLDALNGDRTTS